MIHWPGEGGEIVGAGEFFAKRVENWIEIVVTPETSALPDCGDIDTTLRFGAGESVGELTVVDDADGEFDDGVPVRPESTTPAPTPMSSTATMTVATSARECPARAR